MTIFNNIHHNFGEKDKLQKLLDNVDIFTKKNINENVVPDHLSKSNITFSYMKPVYILSFRLFTDEDDHGLKNLNDVLEYANSCGFIFKDPLNDSLKESIAKLNSASDHCYEMIQDLKRFHCEITFIFDEYYKIDDINIEVYLTIPEFSMALLAKFDIKNDFHISYNVISYLGNELFNRDLDNLPENILECIYIEEKLKRMNYHPYPSRLEIKNNLEHFISLINMTYI
jgi:hypothetical protein